MCRQAAAIAAVLSCFLIVTPVSGDGVRIEQTGLEVVGGTLELRYRIINDSPEDIWLCKEIARGGTRCEVYSTDDGDTLMIRRRFDVSSRMIYALPPTGSYVRLARGRVRDESLLLDLPITERSIYAGGARDGYAVFAERIVVEIGHYTGDLFEKLLEATYDGFLHGRRRRPTGSALKYLVDFNRLSEPLRAWNEEVVAQAYGPFPGDEEILRLTVDWPEEVPRYPKAPVRWTYPPNLGLCSRIEIRCVPSVLEYFYPYDSQQALFSATEREALDRQREIVIADSNAIGEFNRRLREFERCGEVACIDRTARITFSSDVERRTLTLYGDDTVESESKQRFAYGYYLPHLEDIIPQIQPFERRIRCAANLSHLWRRLCPYRVLWRNAASTSPPEDGVAYPEPSQWCDAMGTLYGSFAENRTWPEVPLYVCPGAGKGRCHYAMNPNCTLGSPGDMVLLFETKAGWNQSGGPGLFTFDNHDPKGGCVLLNDGTVKFIRTEAELHALRWE